MSDAEEPLQPDPERPLQEEHAFRADLPAPPPGPTDPEAEAGFTDRPPGRPPRPRRSRRGPRAEHLVGPEEPPVLGPALRRFGYFALVGAALGCAFELVGGVCAGGFRWAEFLLVGAIAAGGLAAVAGPWRRPLAFYPLLVLSLALAAAWASLALSWPH